MQAAIGEAGRKPRALKIDLFDQGGYNIMLKSVNKLGSFTTVLAAILMEDKKLQALKVDLVDQGGYNIVHICP